MGNLREARINGCIALTDGKGDAVRECLAAHAEYVAMREERRAEREEREARRARSRRRRSSVRQSIRSGSR